MPAKFPDVFPREIRDQIWKYVFASPTGKIYISMTHPEPQTKTYKIFGSAKKFPQDRSDKISLASLRTCKRMYEECKELLWICNSLNLESLRDKTHVAEDFYDFMYGVHNIGKIKLHVRHVDVDILLSCYLRHDPSSSYELPDLLKSLKSCPRIQTITLYARDISGNEPMAFSPGTIRNLIHMKNLSLRPNLQAESDGTAYFYQNLLTTLRGDITDDGALPRAPIKRSLVLQTPRPLFNKIHGLPRHIVRGYRGDPEEIMMEIHQAWGGSLIVNGVVCYEDGKQIESIYVEGIAEPGMMAYYERQSIRAWAAALKYGKDYLMGPCGALFAMYDDKTIHKNAMDPWRATVSKNEEDSHFEGLFETFKDQINERLPDPGPGPTPRECLELEFGDFSESESSSDEYQIGHA